MLKIRIFLVHCWGGKTEGGWYSWIKEALEKQHFTVIIPAMPDPDTPVIDAWVDCLSHAVGTPDAQTYFIGQSIGCQTILRYLEKTHHSVGGAVFIAGWFHLENLESKEAEAIARPWIIVPINLTKVRTHLLQSVAFFSDDDPWVPLSDAAIFKNYLCTKIIVEKHKGHYTEEDGISAGPRIPSLLKELTTLIHK